MDQTQIDELKRLHQEATDSKWSEDDGSIFGIDHVGVVRIGTIYAPYDANLVITIRNALPDLLAEVERLQSRLTIARGKLIQADDEIDRLRQENEQLRESNRWIPIEERIPDDGEQVWGLLDNCRVFFFVENGKRLMVTYRDVIVSADKVTHWMPFPNPPKIPHAND